MGVPFAEHLGPFGDPLERECGIHYALPLTTTPEIVRHCTFDPAVLSIDETEVLVLRRTRAIDRELLADVQQHFIIEARRRRRIACPGQDACDQQNPRRAEYPERMGA